LKKLCKTGRRKLKNEKLIYHSKIYHQLGAPGARAPYITKSISSQIRNPNLYSRKVSERQIAQIICVYLARKNIAEGVNFTPLPGIGLINHLDKTG